MSGGRISGEVLLWGKVVRGEYESAGDVWVTVAGVSAGPLRVPEEQILPMSALPALPEPNEKSVVMIGGKVYQRIGFRWYTTQSGDPLTWSDLVTMARKAHQLAPEVIYSA